MKRIVGILVLGAALVVARSVVASVRRRARRGVKHSMRRVKRSMRRMRRG